MYRFIGILALFPYAGIPAKAVLAVMTFLPSHRYRTYADAVHNKKSTYVYFLYLVFLIERFFQDLILRVDS